MLYGIQSLSKEAIKMAAKDIIAQQLALRLDRFTSDFVNDLYVSRRKQPSAEKIVDTIMLELVPHIEAMANIYLEPRVNLNLTSLDRE